jgi:hypothetical protein
MHKGDRIVKKLLAAIGLASRAMILTGALVALVVLAPTTFTLAMFASPVTAQTITAPAAVSGVSSVQGLTGAVTLTQPQIPCPINILTTGNYTAVAANCTIEVNKATGAATTITLPNGVTSMQFNIVDGKGDAATNNITITPPAGVLINGASTFVISTNRGAATVQFDGTQWIVI